MNDSRKPPSFLDFKKPLCFREFRKLLVFQDFRRLGGFKELIRPPGGQDFRRSGVFQELREPGAWKSGYSLLRRPGVAQEWEGRNTGSTSSTTLGKY